MSSPPKTFYEQELDRLDSEIAIPAKHYVLIRQSKRFIEEYYPEKIDLDDLAKAAFMSRFHYIRVFKQVYGVTPRNYLKDMRISKAKELLKQGNSVTDTCMNVGYESLATFSATFKKSTSYSPKEYKRLYEDSLK
ncbi:AraC family transcriptional regulator [Vibrio gigantis]|uniref:helix-turn-helix domain-containing protein n=1 Tax=Vibrio gigantis TaxID=296199 RepID=UPI001EFC29C2|nr:AraC family transcriptional regulator [Vibrio gigantis]ULN65462.1 AraC family transcriptional regulator [Vibrio gigantis]